MVVSVTKYHHPPQSSGKLDDKRSLSDFIDDIYGSVPGFYAESYTYEMPPTTLIYIDDPLDH